MQFTGHEKEITKFSVTSKLVINSQANKEIAILCKCPDPDVYNNTVNLNSLIQN